MDHTLTAKSISHAFGKKQILSDVDIACHTGEILAIFGRNGTGKSTLLKILFGVLPANSGEVFIDGKIVADRTRLNQWIAYHHQEVFLPKNAMVRDLIPLYFPDGEKQNKLFYEKGISKIANQKVGALSIGEQRFLQFLFILYRDHLFIMLDEPFSMIEPLYNDLIKEKMEIYRSQKGFIITDHYYADVLQIASRKLVMVDTKIKDVNTNADLVASGYLSTI